jgi:hypothetical protein
MLVSFFDFLWRSRKWIWRLGVGSADVSCARVQGPRFLRRFAPSFEQLESRETPSNTSVLVAASYADKGIYAFDSQSGSLLATLVAPNSSPLIQGPSGLALGADGDFYISDYPTSSILQYNPSTNTLATFVSPSNFQSAAGMSGAGPDGLQFGPDGNLYVSNLNSQQVLRFNITNAGGNLIYSGNSVIVASGFYPTGMTFGTAHGDTNNLYVSSYSPREVLKVANASSQSPISSVFLGLGGVHSPSPFGLAWGPDGDLYAGALPNYGTLAQPLPTPTSVLQISSNGSSYKSITPSSGPGSLFNNAPDGLIFDGLGHLLVSTSPNANYLFGPFPSSSGQIYQYNADGSYSNTLVTSGTNGIPANFSPSSILLLPSLVIPSPTTPTHFAITTSATSVLAGGTVDVTLTVEDSQNNPLPNYTGTVQLSSTDVKGLWNGSALPGNYTFTTADAGVHTLTVTLETAGSQTITAVDQTFLGISANTGPITVTAGPANKLIVSVVGGNNATAGNVLSIGIQAWDQYGNPASGNVMLSAGPNADPLSNFPINGKLSSNGYSVFAGVLKTAGTYIITATSGSASAPSQAITIYPADASYFTLTAPTSAITGNPINVTATAYDKYGNLTPQYRGTVKLNVTQTGVSLGNNYTFTSSLGAGTDNGMHTFSVILNKSGSQSISITDVVSKNPIISGTSNAVLVSGLQVTSLNSTANGFTVNFNKAFVPNDLTLYDNNLKTVMDVVLVGAHVGPIHGSLIIDPTNTSLTFKATSSYLLELNSLQGQVSAVFPDDTYTVTLVSGLGTNGFVDGLGAHLDGANSGGHANYTTTFTTQYQANATPVLGIPDFARGPDSNSPIEVPNDSASGIPITLYNAANVTDVTFSLTYNPSLLTITGALSGTASDATDAAATLTLLSNSGGVATFHYIDSNPQSATALNPLVLGDIGAVVPSGAGAAALSLYQTKELLQLGNIVINQGAIPGAVSANGIHVNAYFGDLNGDKVISGLDTLSADMVAQGRATGVSAFTQLDPVIVGDVAGDKAVDAGDVSAIDLFVAQFHPVQIPQPPTQLLATNPNYVNPNGLHSPNAADPTLSLTRGLTALGAPLVSVNIDHPDPEGSAGLTSVTLALTYDATLLSVTPADITLGSIPSGGSGWQLSAVVDQATGKIGIQLFSLTPITLNDAGSLVDIAFQLIGDPTGVSPRIIRLVDAVTPNGQWFGTGLADAQGALILSTGVNQVLN